MILKTLYNKVLVGLRFLFVLWFEVLDSDSLPDLFKTFELGLLFLGVDHFGWIIYLFIICIGLILMSCEGF